MKKVFFAVIGAWALTACNSNANKHGNNLVTVDTTEYVVIKKSTGIFIDTTLNNRDLMLLDNKLQNMTVLQIPLNKQPYLTPAYHFANKNGNLVAFVSADKVDQNVCLTFHEFFEGISCRLLGVTQHSIDSFDRQWQPRPNGPEEPGAEFNAPYHWQHEAALAIEWKTFEMFFRLEHGEYISFVQPDMRTPAGMAWFKYNKHMYELQQPTNAQKK